MQSAKMIRSHEPVGANTVQLTFRQRVLGGPKTHAGAIVAVTRTEVKNIAPNDRPRQSG